MTLGNTSLKSFDGTIMSCDDNNGEAFRKKELWRGWTGAGGGGDVVVRR